MLQVLLLIGHGEGGIGFDGAGDNLRFGLDISELKLMVKGYAALAPPERKLPWIAWQCTIFPKPLLKTVVKKLYAYAFGGTRLVNRAQHICDVVGVQRIADSHE